MEAATGNRLGQELHRRIFRPLGLRDSCFPVNALGIPSPMSCGYRLALSPRADVTGGQLVDVTLQNPSHAWRPAPAARSMVNVGERAPNPVSEAFLQGYRALGRRLLTLQDFD